MLFYERAPAKINLSLDVIGNRNDGYHEVEMIMTSIDLADGIEICPLIENRIEVRTDSQYVPNDERNLAYQAVQLFKRVYHIDKGVQITIRKNIPVSAGLGGGSSDAAAVLRGLNRMWGVYATLSELANIGEQIGSDVPFCIYGRTALATGRGEVIHELPSLPPCYVLLANPSIGISTRTIFKHVLLRNTKHPHTDRLIQAIRAGDFRKMCLNVGNSLEDVTCREYPEVWQLRQKMIQLGTTGVVMSGSGPTIVGLVEHQRKAKRIYNGLRGFCEKVMIVNILNTHYS